MTPNPRRNLLAALAVASAVLSLACPGDAAQPFGKGKNDPAFSADRELCRYLLANRKNIRRDVKKLGDGVETLTESDKAEVAKKIQEHALAMHKRVNDGKGIHLCDMAKAAWIDLGKLERAAGCLKVLAHPHRLRIVERLLAGRHTVGELADACGIPSNIASGHLRLMQRCGFLAPERDGRSVYYAVTEPCLKKLLACVRERFAGDED